MSNGAGSWEAPLETALEIVGVHAVVLHTGHVLYWCFDKRAVGQLNKNEQLFKTLFRDPDLGSYQVWDPVSGKPVGPAEAIGSNSFCSGQCTLPDGTIFVPGGQDAAGGVEPEEVNNWDVAFETAFVGTDNGGLKRINTYDPLTDEWTRWPDMPEGRYYPTCLLTDDGGAFLAGGLSNLLRWILSGANSNQNDQFATYFAGELAFPAPPQQFRCADQYPIIRQLPGSRHLFVHIDTTTYLFDLDSSSFIAGAQFTPPGVGRQTYPMQTGHVLLPQKEGAAPRILIVGGSTATGFDFDTHSNAPAVQNAFIFEYDAAEPTKSSWRLTRGDPRSARLLSDTVLLPDGTVFVVNGIVSGAAAGHSGPTVGTAEIFDPETETFTQVAPPSAHQRAYHATAVLLPDARVAVAGNTAAYNPGEGESKDDDVSIEIYSPPYLSAGPRPTLPSSIPASVEYGQTLTLENGQAPAVEKVMMMHPCAVTHSVDMDQLAIWLATAPGAGPGTLAVTFPKDRTLAPPGPYMLFGLAAGVPSVATWVFLGVPAPQLPSGTNGSSGGEDCEKGGPYPPVNLGKYEGKGRVSEQFDGNCSIENVNEEFNLELESRHGSISIAKKIEQHSWANLTACSTVEIGEKIDQHSIATIVANKDIKIGQKIDQHSSGTLTSRHGMIEIGQGVDAESHAVLTAGTSVVIGQKIDQHSTATIVAQGDVIIGQGLDQHTISEITSENGNIFIHEEITNSAEATLSAPNGTITVGKVSGGAKVKWHAKAFNCPDTSGGTVTQF